MMGQRAKRGITRITWLLVATALLAAPHVAGQQAIDKTASEIFGTVMSPFCPGMTIATCPSSQAAALRDEVRAQLAAGATKEEVLDSLYARWGEDVLGPRSATGVGLLAWLIPAVAILVGAAGLTLWLRSSSRRVQAAPPEVGELDPEAERRIREELAEL
jgi:cytochrome c-type biogenesis protein CcmH